VHITCVGLIMLMTLYAVFNHLHYHFRELVLISGTIGFRFYKADILLRDVF